MKVLQLCNKPPYPPVDGGSMAMNSITQGLLAAGHEVWVLAVSSDKHPVQQSRIDDHYLQSTHFQAVHVDLAVHPLDAAVAMLCGESYHVKRYISSTFQDKLIEILDAEVFDIIHVESIFLSPYIPTIRRHSSARVVLRAHNVEHHIWRQLARSCRNPFKAYYLRHTSLALGAYEREHIGLYDAVLCITQSDADYFRSIGFRRPIQVIPFAVSPEPLDSVGEEAVSLFHIGSMDWRPNLEAIDWLLQKAWPKIHAAVPQAKLYLAGRNMPQRLLSLQGDGISVVGEVPDALYFIASKQINIVPLQSGSGIRVKIIEAMSAGKTVIATSVAAQGIRYTDGVDILIANSPDEFAMQVKRCADDPDFCRQIGRNAYRLVLSDYDASVLSRRLIDFYELLLEQ